MSATAEPARPAPSTTPRTPADIDAASRPPAATRRVVARPVVRTPAAQTPGPYVPTPAGDAVVARVAGCTDELSRLLLAEHSTTGVLQKVVEAARAHVPGVAEASVTVLENGRVSSVAWTGLLAYELDETQYESGFGPCLDAARTGTARWVQDSSADRRWPVYLSAAVHRGALSSFSVPLPLPVAAGPQVGLNLYSTEVDGLCDAAREAARHLARRAATVVANRQAYDLARGEADNLRRAMESRAVIEQAKGALLFAAGLSADEAFQALSHRSQVTNVRVHELVVQLLADIAAGRGRAAVDALLGHRRDGDGTR
ncbi:MAG: Response regulator with antiterminator output domain [Klenkia sp.]|nr:Response regulator with antiterminator output domain [Klenkia sp.]